MSESLMKNDKTIYNEMMSHSVLFTHANPETVAIISNDASILHEILKHQSVKNLYFFSKSLPKENIDKRVAYHDHADLSHILSTANFDIILNTLSFSSALMKTFFHALLKDGILMQQCNSLFELDSIKNLYESFQNCGFQDVHLLHFPQSSFSSPWRASIMAIKNNNFRKVREKDIYNKAFTTSYYNFDMHNAALAMPEFLRKELETI